LEDDSSGSNPDRGLLPRVFDFIFSQIAREALLSSPVTYAVKASYLEIYQERPYDLLEPDTQNLNIREDAKKGVYVENLHEIPVQNATDALKLAVIGAQNRRVAATAMNRESSRSHALFCLTISSKEVKDGVTQTRTSRFHLCDLAGSERQGDTKTAGTQLQEAGAINKSLSGISTRFIFWYFV
jgi:kinesin family protein 15